MLLWMGGKCCCGWVGHVVVDGWEMLMWMGERCCGWVGDVVVDGWEMLLWIGG